ncbi:lysozyme [Pokkaliibacter plantistimulans]|uniref:Lysozyme n=1 Tax=Pokkaliibacter plantistimulans TaxID=1635171 RepID=A0ABX5M5K0_9GAMM|nr:type VI secretion system baseplate subunit TssE [Pokkaliibacter plantistimulans]PXF32190.1 lysozyme [Pokkaliibacter plantistimulans]
MAADSKVRIVPSILDRLLDDDPGDHTLAAQDPAFNLRQMRASVRRDLEDLLNSRVSWQTWPEAYTELQQSLLSYGLPDFSIMPVSSQDARQRLCRIVEDTIRKFEPRFADVRVEVAEEGGLATTLRLRINAVMYAIPVPEEVSFDTELEPVTLGLRLLEKL